jgi:hypothetical protein
MRAFLVTGRKARTAIIGISLCAVIVVGLQTRAESQPTSATSAESSDCFVTQVKLRYRQYDQNPRGPALVVSYGMYSKGKSCEGKWVKWEILDSSGKKLQRASDILLKPNMIWKCSAPQGKKIRQFRARAQVGGDGGSWTWSYPLSNRAKWAEPCWRG